MNEYEVIFAKGKKRHIVRVKEAGIIPAIDAAVHKHLTRYTNALEFEIVGAQLVG